MTMARRGCMYKNWKEVTSSVNTVQCKKEGEREENLLYIFFFF